MDVRSERCFQKIRVAFLCVLMAGTAVFPAEAALASSSVRLAQLSQPSQDEPALQLLLRKHRPPFPNTNISTADQLVSALTTTLPGSDPEIT